MGCKKVRIVWNRPRSKEIAGNVKGRVKKGRDRSIIMANGGGKGANAKFGG